MNQIQDENFENIQSKNGDSGLKTEQGNNKKDMEIEEGEVHSQTDDKPKKGSNKDDADSSDEDTKAKAKKAKKEKKHKHSEKESKEKGSRKDKDEESEKKKKKKEGKSKKADKKDRGSPSRSKSPKKKHRSSPSFSKNTKSNRKKSDSNSRSRSRSKTKDERRKRLSRSRSNEIRRKKDRSYSRSRRRSPSDTRKRSTKRDSRHRDSRYSPRRDRGTKRTSRSPGRTDRRRERSSTRRSKERREERRERRDEEIDRRKKEENKPLIEEEPVDEEFSKRLEMAFANVEEDEEKIARERREQRRALLEKLEKKEEEKSNQQPETMEEEPKAQSEIKEQISQHEKEAAKDLKTKIQEEVPILQKEQEEEKDKKEISEIIKENEQKENKIETEGNKETEDLDEGPVRKWSANHNIEKEKYIKLIESMREKLQKEEEDLEEEMKEEEEKKQKEEEAKAEKNQDFDMFVETPESLEAEKVSKPTVSGDMQSYTDEKGYYRGQIGELIGDRYRIQAKLGKGVFGNVFRGHDTKTNQDIAIKILKNEEIYTMSGLKEREILSMLNESDKHNKRHVIRLLDSIEYRKHLVLIFELMEMDLRHAIKTFGKKLGLSLESVRSYARQLFIALAHLKKHKIIHADLKPDNILVTNNQKTLKLSDFGSAFPVEENTITPYLVARYYRAPEIMLGCTYDTAVDIWSAACTIFELYTGKILFPGRDNNEMLKLIIQTKGRFNNKMLKRGEFSSQYFDHHNNFLSEEIDPVTKEKYKKPIPIGNKITRDIGIMLNALEIELSQDDKKKIAQLKDLLERCLTLDPNKRMTAEEALKSQFINYGLQKFAMDSNSLKHVF